MHTNCLVLFFRLLSVRKIMGKVTTYQVDILRSVTKSVQGTR